MSIKGGSIIITSLWASCSKVTLLSISEKVICMETDWGSMTFAKERGYKPAMILLCNVLREEMFLNVFINVLFTDVKTSWLATKMWT